MPQVNAQLTPLERKIRRHERVLKRIERVKFCLDREQAKEEPNQARIGDHEEELEELQLEAAFLTKKIVREAGNVEVKDATTEG